MITFQRDFFLNKIYLEIVFDLLAPNMAELVTKQLKSATFYVKLKPLSEKQDRKMPGILSRTTRGYHLFSHNNFRK